MMTSRPTDRSVARAGAVLVRKAHLRVNGVVPVALLLSSVGAALVVPADRVGVRPVAISSAATCTSSHSLERLPQPNRGCCSSAGTTLTGAQPAKFTRNGKIVRPVGRESDKALALLQSLDAQQRSKAVLSYQVRDLVLGPGQDGKKITPEGLKVSEMNARQQALLLDLISEWAGIINQKSATARMAEIKADLNATWFAWSGPTTGEVGNTITGYYRIQGPHLVIEYAPQSDEPSNHVHTMYRDPTNDYGSASVNK